MIARYSQMRRTDKYSQQSSIIWLVWPNGWVFVYELSGWGFDSRSSWLNFRYRACVEQGVLWHSGKYTMCIYSEMRTWHITRYNQMHLIDKYSQHSSIIWPVWPNGWVFIYQLSGCGLESRCSNLNLRYSACFKQGVPWHSGKSRVVDSLWKAYMTYNKIQSNAPYW